MKVKMFVSKESEIFLMEIDEFKLSPVLLNENEIVNMNLLLICIWLTNHRTFCRSVKTVNGLSRRITTKKKLQQDSVL